ncbi:MAG: serine--tRNA ligase, partial [Terriglobia bacterium]
MLDLRFVRESLELVKQKLKDRGAAPDLLDGFEDLDRERRKLLSGAEARKARR